MSVFCENREHNCFYGSLDYFRFVKEQIGSRKNETIELSSSVF